MAYSLNTHFPHTLPEASADCGQPSPSQGQLRTDHRDPSRKALASRRAEGKELHDVLQQVPRDDGEGHAAVARLHHMPLEVHGEVRKREVVHHIQEKLLRYGAASWCSQTYNISAHNASIERGYPLYNSVHPRDLTLSMIGCRPSHRASP